MSVDPAASTLRLSGPAELTAATAPAFRASAQAALLPGHLRVELDLAATRFIDSSGLGALLALHKQVMSRGGSVRLLYPQPAVQQILELTRMHRVFEVVTTV